MIDIVMTWLTNTFFWEKSEAKINENFYNKLKNALSFAGKYQNIYVYAHTTDESFTRLHAKIQ